MRLGAYTACLHDKPLKNALDVLAGLGLDSAEINSGGFLPAVHLPIEDLRSSETARSEYLALFDEAGVALTALNCNGNPLDPDPEGARQARDIYTSIELAALLGVKRVVTMSGTPGSEPSSRLPVWNVVPWHSAFLRIRDYQWNEVAIPFWKKVQAFAADHDVKVCLEMHPGNVVFNPRTLERLATEIGATHVGAEMDPSHLFWQGIDPTEAVRSLGDLVYNAAAKDTRINPLSRVNGNPLDPDPEGAKQAQDIYTSIEVAALLGVKRVVTMSGVPGSEPSSTLPVWNVVPWHSAFLQIRVYQW